MKRLTQQYAAEGLTAIWIGFQDRPDKIRGFAENLNIRPVGYDERDTVARYYGVSYGAGVIFIDATGTVRKRVAKGFTEAALREGVQAVIHPPATPAAAMPVESR